METSRFGRREYLLLAMGTIAFTIYGSYVPFQYRYRPWGEVTSSFAWAMQNRTAFESRSDGFANWMLGVPLGFCSLGAIRAWRTNGLATALIGGCLVPLCALFAAAVEFGQLYFPTRTCSGTDVIAQSFGALCGVLGWVLFGPWLTGQLGRFFRDGSNGTRSLRFLAGYAIFVAFVQWLPLDFTISPHDIYRWLRRGYLKVSYFPFEELRSPAWRNGSTVWDKVQSWLELAMLFFPLGLLLSRPGWEKRAWRIPAFAFSFAFLTEAIQITVSRHPSSADVIVGCLSILAGYAVSKLVSTLFFQRHRMETALILGQVWLIVMILIHWQPFDWIAGRFVWDAQAWECWPLATQVSENYLRSLDRVMMKFVVYAPLGILLAWAGRWSMAKPIRLRAATMGGAVALLLEVGQTALPGRHFSPTDVLFGILGGWIGVAIAMRVISTGAPAKTPFGATDA